MSGFVVGFVVGFLVGLVAGVSGFCVMGLWLVLVDCV